MPVSWATGGKPVASKDKRKGAKKSVGKKPRKTVKARGSSHRPKKIEAKAGPIEEGLPPSCFEKFELDSFIRKVWELGGYVPSKQCNATLLAASGCTGSNSFGYVLRHMARCAGQKVRDLYGSDWDLGAQHFLLRNKRNPECLFQDMKDVTGGAKTAPCIVHCKMCPIPPRGDLFQCGFSCCWNSQQNPSRFKQDIVLNPHPVHEMSYQATLAHLRERKPKVALLENTTGLRLARGGGNPAPALDKVLQDLDEICPSKVGVATLDAKPLCTQRPRLFFFVGFMEQAANQGKALAEEATVLAEKVSSLPQHHLSTFLGAESRSKQVALGLQQTAVSEARRSVQYHAAFAAGLELAIKKKRLAEDTSPGQHAERPSMTHEALKGQSPWLQAQADLYFLIGQTLAKKQCLELDSLVADIGQSADRGKVTLNGTIPSCCTSSCLYHYGKKTFLTIGELFNSHGYCPSKLSFRGLTCSDCSMLLGNITVSTSLVVALTPMLRALGVLELDSSKSKE